MLFNPADPKQIDEMAAAARGILDPDTGKVIDLEIEDPTWQEGLMWSNPLKGPPKIVANLFNAIYALRECPSWKGCLRYNEFADRVEIVKPLPIEAGAVGGEWSDRLTFLTAAWLQHHGIGVSSDVAGAAVYTVGRDATYHPVRDYLDGLKWDGKERIDTWLTDVLGSYAQDLRDCQLKIAVGRKFLISAVARIMRPGCKVDTVLVLEGKQGIGKSTVSQILFDPWFCDHMPDLGTKDAFLQVQGKWGIELAELDALSRVEMRQVKAFLSSPMDRYRDPYGKVANDHPRGCVFIGTTNQDEWQSDETGGRRFWPVRCGEIDLDYLRESRDQFWAEAVVAFRADEPWWIDDKEVLAEAAEQVRDRFVEDVWTEPVMGKVAAYEKISKCFTTADLLMSIKDSTDHWVPADGHRVGRIMKAAGYELKQCREAGEDRGKRFWVKV